MWSKLWSLLPAHSALLSLRETTKHSSELIFPICHYNIVQCAATSVGDSMHEGVIQTPLQHARLGSLLKHLVILLWREEQTVLFTAQTFPLLKMDLWEPSLAVKPGCKLACRLISVLLIYIGADFGLFSCTMLQTSPASLKGSPTSPND